jgi:hypothetical protein
MSYDHHDQGTEIKCSAILYTLPYVVLYCFAVFPLCGVWSETVICEAFYWIDEGVCLGFDDDEGIVCSVFLMLGIPIWMELR